MTETESNAAVVPEGFALIRVDEHPELAEAAAKWYSEKWDIPVDAYRESISQSLAGRGVFPRWYLVLDRGGGIAAGAGLIDNDFHDRPDLSPNVCAVYTEPPHRRRGLARALLGRIRADAAERGVERLYLVTDHTGFYERCGWRYLCDVRDDCGTTSRMYTAPARL